MDHSCRATLLKCVVCRLNGFIVGGGGRWVLQPLTIAATTLGWLYLLGGCWQMQNWAELCYLSRLFFLPMKVDPPDDAHIWQDRACYPQFFLSQWKCLGGATLSKGTVPLDDHHLSDLCHWHWTPIIFWQFPVICKLAGAGELKCIKRLLCQKRKWIWLYYIRTLALPRNWLL